MNSKMHMSWILQRSYSFYDLLLATEGQGHFQLACNAPKYMSLWRLVHRRKCKWQRSIDNCDNEAMKVQSMAMAKA
jgi:hypothetical protein